MTRVAGFSENSMTFIMVLAGLSMTAGNLAGGKLSDQYGVARGGEMMGAACVQVAFNLGNAIGAYAGGLPISAGLGYRYPALVGVFIVLMGFIAISLYSKRESASLSRI